MLTPVLLSGGVGSRLWPVSRESHPKQFLPLAGELSMLQETLRRTSGLEEAPPLVVCNEEHRFIAAEQLRQGGLAHNGIILESSGRNTAPAICLAALLAGEISPNRTLLVLPADHHMGCPEAFTQAVTAAALGAPQESLVTFGITLSLH